MKRIGPVFFTCACLAALAGCAGPRPVIPGDAAITPPPGWRSVAAPNDSGTVAADWWDAFGDPALTQTVQLALLHNDDVAIAAERVEAARAEYRLAEAERLPDVGGAAEGGRERDLNPGFGVAEKQSFGVGAISATWDLDLFGRLRNSSRAARAALLASQDTQAAVKLAVASSTAQGYINLRALDARMLVVRRTLAVRADALNVAHRRSGAGYSPDFELHQAEAEYHAAEQLVPATELAIRRQEDGLSLLLGKNPGDIARGLDLQSIIPPIIGAGLPAGLLRRRPDIAAAEQRLVSADRTLDAVRASFMPDLSLSGQAGGVLSTLIAQSPTSTYVFAASILGPIMDSGRLRAQQHGAAARRNEAAFAYRKAALGAFRDVEDALASVQRSSEQEVALVKERDALAATLRQATSRYRAGYSPYLEQIDAERALLSSELTLAVARGSLERCDQSLPGAWRRVVVLTCLMFPGWYAENWMKPPNRGIPRSAPARQDAVDRLN